MRAFDPSSWIRTPSRSLYGRDSVPASPRGSSTEPMVRNARGAAEGLAPFVDVPAVGDRVTEGSPGENDGEGDPVAAGSPLGPPVPVSTGVDARQAPSVEVRMHAATMIALTLGSI